MPGPTWSDRVRAVRAVLKMTQKEFAAYLGVSKAAVHAWEARAEAPWSREATKFAKLEQRLHEEAYSGVEAVDG